ncbi:hypothetical protein [Pseudoduganella sp. HUAS MS19]
MRHAPWGKAGALLLTVLAHLAFLFGARGDGSASRPQPQPPRAALMVALLPAPAAASIQAATPVTPVNAPAPGRPQPAVPAALPEPPVEAEHDQAPPQFFPLHDLTSPPTVAGGLTRGELLELPDTSGGYITAHFWINALGEVVRAQVVGADGNEDEEEKLLAALRHVRFLPARIGHMAVHSQLQLELRVVRNAGL